MSCRQHRETVHARGSTAALGLPHDALVSAAPALVGVAVQVTLQGQRLRFAEALPFPPVLTQELLNFRVKIDPATAHDSYSAWRERDHDDLVLALALAVGWGKKSSSVACHPSI